MTPTLRRATDSEDGMDRWLASLRDEMKVGFEGVNRRLDTMNVKVIEHAETIAGLRAGCSLTGSLIEQVRDLSETIAAHRARCPYDAQGDITATAARARWTNAQLAGGVAGGSVGLWVLMQIAEWLVQRQLGQ